MRQLSRNAVCNEARNLIGGGAFLPYLLCLTLTWPHQLQLTGPFLLIKVETRPVVRCMH